MNKIKIIVILILLSFSGCDLIPTSPNKTQPVNEKTFKLDVGQFQQFAWRNYTIGFDTVLQDSRIDSSGVFITGAADIRIWVHKPRTDTLFYTMRIFNKDVTELYFPTVNPPDFLLSLKELSPSEAPSRHINYEATFHLIEYNTTEELVATIIPSSKPQEEIFNFFYNVDTAGISGDTLHMRINHPGGCEAHYYIAYMSPLVFSKSNPVQADIYISHYNNNDFCFAMLYPGFRLDLSQIKKLYQEQYSESGEIILNLYDNYRRIKIGKSVSYKF